MKTMSRRLTTLLILAIPLLLTACSQQETARVVQDKTVLKNYLTKYPMPVPTARTYQGTKSTANWALRTSCTLHQYLMMKLPSYCPKTVKAEKSTAIPLKWKTTTAAKVLLKPAYLFLTLNQKMQKKGGVGMSGSDIYQTVSELKRVQNNQFHSGQVVSVSGNQAIVNIHMSETIKSQPLTCIGRTDLVANEPVFVILPTAEPDYGFVFPLLPSPPVYA